jgi:Aldehyde dehydrogenase family
LTNAGPGMRLFDEETFGPVAALAVAAHVDEAVALANSTPFGLVLSLWTGAPDRGRPSPDGSRPAPRAEHLKEVQAVWTPAGELVAAGAALHVVLREDLRPLLVRDAFALTVGVVAHPELVTAEETLSVVVETQGAYTPDMNIADWRPDRTPTAGAGAGAGGRSTGSDRLRRRPRHVRTTICRPRHT